MKKFLVVAIAVMALTVLVVVPAFSVDKLVVKDSTPSANTVFVVQDTGRTGIGTASPIAQLHTMSQSCSDASRGGQFAYHASDICGSQLTFKKSRGTESSPTALANGDFIGGFDNKVYDGTSYLQGRGYFTFLVDGPVTTNSVPVGFVIKTGSTEDWSTRSFYVSSSGYVGVGVNSPANPLQFGAQANNAYIDATGSYHSSSSRQYKDDIQTLSAEKAVEALKDLTPVTYNYKNTPDKQRVGFIAEDVPELVASKDRQTLVAMDIVAVLTKVVQEQNKTIEALSAKIDKIEKASKDNKNF